MASNGALHLPAIAVLLYGGRTGRQFEFDKTFRPS
jgi:hypothetical protein